MTYLLSFFCEYIALWILLLNWRLISYKFLSNFFTHFILVATYNPRSSISITRATNDLYICPDGWDIRFDRYANRTDKYGYTRLFKMYASADCSGCPLYDMCIKSDKQINKRIQKNMHLEYFKAQVKHQLSTKENRAICQQRKVDIESVFGYLKANLSFRRFSVRGARKVKIE